MHPDLDHLYRAKGHIQDSGKDAMHISAFKKNESFNHITNKLPKDTKGFVTPEGIDKHIESLPKHKVDIRVLDAYNRTQEQKHRKDATEYTLSMNMHPETKAKMSADQLQQWDSIKGKQHSWEPQDKNGSFTGTFDSLKGKDQMGWVRIDPHKKQMGKIAGVTAQHVGKIADTSDGGSVWHDGKDNFTIKHPKGNVSAWYDREANRVSNQWSKDGHADELEEGLHPRSTAGYGFSEEELKDPKIMAHLLQADEIIKNHGDTKSEQKEHPHWHLDEIQSDFQNPSKIKSKLSSHDPIELARTHPDFNTTSDQLQEAAQADPNHPLMQEWQDIDDGNHYSTRDRAEQRDDDIDSIVAPYAERIMRGKYPELNTPPGEDPVDLTTAQEDELADIISDEKENASQDPDHPLYDQVNNEYENFEADPDNEAKKDALDMATYSHLKDKDPKYFEPPEDKDPKKMLEHLSLGHDDPQHMLHSAANALARKLNVKSTSMDTPEDQAEKSVLRIDSKHALPVHQVDTYSKRPKKLGMVRVDKESLLGSDPNDKAKEIQYAKLHKRLKSLYTQLEKLKKIT